MFRGSEDEMPQRGSFGTRLEERVERAGAVALEIQGHIGEAEGFETRGNALRQLDIKRPRQLIAVNFDAGEIAVSAKSELPETQIAQKRFAAFDARQQFRRDGCSISDARREASRGRAIPGIEASLAG